ncbi:hypothetical protein F0U44_12985 [Nocardioides humilatus]|uniref:Uncharacterized protein n=1 Tax=Nocardioides humilatus TaxID=2607660 RepID=A0A5B1LIB0_9ACTN|nr:hypothetical protein [Nocardioides humilatus]KAA1419349.1 hypothetical protein F0U44_12985 [Nocardioides humilatus]
MARILGTLAGLALVIGLGASGARGDEGLPTPPDGRIGGSVGSSGEGEIAVAQQQFRLPRMALWASVGTADDGSDPPHVHAEIYIMSPTGSRHRYGDGPEFGVRTLAFGLIPAEATVQIVQVRDGAYPEPWIVGGGPVLSEGDHVLTGRAELRISGLALDGQQVRDLTGVCRAPVDLRLEAGPGYLPYGGGEMTGAIDVPAFHGCGNRYLDRLVTSMVSGPDNELTVRQGAISIGKPWPDSAPG